MSDNKPFALDKELSSLPTEPKERHETFVDLFGQFLFWLRNWSMDASRKMVGSEEEREKIGTIRRNYYEGVAQMPAHEREAALLLTEETVNGFAERLLWFLGDEGTDARLGSRHAYRFRVVMEIVDVETGQIVEEENINRGGKFFGSYWGRWLNRYGSMRTGDQKR